MTTLTVVNVRTGPGTNFDIIGKAPAGSSYGFVGQEGDWYKIDFNGTQGYVSATYSTLGGGAAGVPGQNFAPGTQVVEANTRINVRSGPTTAAAIVAKLNGGQALAYLGTEGGWYVVDLNGTRAFVSADFSHLETR